jgi:hypothetical protein
LFLDDEEDPTIIDEEMEMESQIVDEPKKTEVLKANKKDNSSRLSPVLNEEKGYFTLGPEAEATHTFLFNVFICFGRNVQLVSTFPALLPGSPMKWSQKLGLAIFSIYFYCSTFPDDLFLILLT